MIFYALRDYNREKNYLDSTVPFGTEWNGRTKRRLFIQAWETFTSRLETSAKNFFSG